MKTSILKIKDIKDIWKTTIEENAFKILMLSPESVNELKESRVVSLELFKESFPKHQIDLYTFEIVIYFKVGELTLQKIECIDKNHYDMNNEITFETNLHIHGKRMDEFSTNEYKINHGAWNTLFDFNEQKAYTGRVAFRDCFEALEEEYLYKENIMPRRFSKEDIFSPEE